MPAELAREAEQHKQAAMAAERRTEAVHVFGVDLMSTSDCVRVFADYGPVRVDWLNESSCKLQQGKLCLVDDSL